MDQIDSPFTAVTRSWSTKLDEMGTFSADDSFHLAIFGSSPMIEALFPNMFHTVYPERGMDGYNLLSQS
jgi:hypothetical protein